MLMINEVGIFLASYSNFYGGGIGESLNRLSELGFFDYVLPFLLIFSIIFGVLSSTKLFKENRGIDAIIALVVAFMALQFDLVPQFFSQVFPRLGVALAGILVVLILLGFFIDPSKSWVMYILLGTGAIAAIAVLKGAAEGTGFYYALNFNENTAIIFGMAIFAIVIVLIVTKVIKPGDTPYKALMLRQSEP